MWPIVVTTPLKKLHLKPRGFVEVLRNGLLDTLLTGGRDVDQL